MSTGGHVEFARIADLLGKLLATSASVALENAPTAAQWLLPLPDGRGAPETAVGLQFWEHYSAEIRALAAAAMRCPDALDLVRRWNETTTPNEDPFRYLARWLD